MGCGIFLYRFDGEKITSGFLMNNLCDVLVISRTSPFTATRLASATVSTPSVSITEKYAIRILLPPDLVASSVSVLMSVCWSVNIFSNSKLLEVQ
ncbi:MAG: hypothetical protein ACI4SD_02530 [Suilimivivens sp.]